MIPTPAPADINGAPIKPGLQAAFVVLRYGHPALATGVVRSAGENFVRLTMPCGKVKTKKPCNVAVVIGETSRAA